jgi:hypothetical protein
METIEKTEMNAAQKAAYIKSELRNFTGTETWFRHPLFRKFLFTEGVQFLAEAAECFWLIDMIYGFQLDQQAVKDEYFQTWDLTVGENKTATLTCGNGNDNIVFTHSLTFTTFPLEGIRLFFTDNVLLLPSEW